MADEELDEPIAQFRDLTNLLINEVAMYVARGEHDEKASANINRIRVWTASLMSALQSAQMMAQTRPPGQAL